MAISFVLSFRLVVFRLFLVSPSSRLFSLPCFPWWRILWFCYFVSAQHPPRAPCEPQVCVVPLGVFFFFFCYYPPADGYPCVLSSFLRCWCWLILYFSRPSLFRFRFGHRLFHPVFFSWVLCCLLGFRFGCDSFSVPYAMYLDTVSYTHLTLPTIYSV